MLRWARQQTHPQTATASATAQSDRFQKLSCHWLRRRKKRIKAAVAASMATRMDTTTVYACIAMGPHL